jgi:uncharacterized membrane protein YbhN (UPF0104 family)
MAATGTRSLPLRTGRAIRDQLLRVEEKPLAVVVAAAGATIVVSFLLAMSVGWGHVSRIAYARHSWLWLGVCLIGELVAYLGYILTLRDIACVDDGPEMDLAASTKTVVAGFGVFAATRGSGGFAVDYWALRREGASRRDAARRVLALGFLEYATLSVVALVAAGALYAGLDGHAGETATFPALLVIPCVALALWATSQKRSRRLSRHRPNGSWLRRMIADSVAGAGKARTILTSPREHGLGVFGMGLYWAGDIACLWAALQLVGGKQITLAALILAYSGGYVLSRRSLPAGGAGVVEVALTLALVGMGVPFAPALVAVLIYRLFNFWLPIVPALMLIPTVRELRGRFQRAEQQAV